LGVPWSKVFKGVLSRASHALKKEALEVVEAGQEAIPASQKVHDLIYFGSFH
jgi:hypothetical protein